METAACPADGSFRKRRISRKSSRVAKHSIGSVSTGTSRQRKSSHSSRKRALHNLFFDTGRKHSEQEAIRKDSRGIASVVYPSRRLSEAVARRPTYTKIEQSTGRRSSEPLTSNMFTTAINQKRHYHKQGFPRKTLGVRKFSTAEALIITNERRLEALAQDELLASLNAALQGECLHPDSFQHHSERVTKNCPSCIHEEVDEAEEDEEQEKEREKREAKRLHILDEILTTEHNYVSCLEIINDVFKYPLQRKGIVSSKNLKLMFPSSLGDILLSHTIFMEQLDDRLRESDSKVAVGDIISEMTSASTKLLDIYTRYVNSFPKSISTLTKYTRGCHKFRKFLELCYYDPLVERLDLPSFLLSPVQRLPRYTLLLTELLKYTESEHPDKDSIRTAKNEIETIIISLDNSIKVSMDSYTSSDSRKHFTRHLSRKKKKVSKSNPEHEKRKNSNHAKRVSLETERDNNTLHLPDPSQSTRSSSVVLRRKKKSPIIGKRPVSFAGTNTSDMLSCDVKQAHRTSWRKSLGSKISHFFQNCDENSNSDSSVKCNGSSPRVETSAEVVP